jgi:hypothetical protein
MVSSTKNPKKNVGGRPRVGSAHMMLTVPPALLGELDAFCAAQLDKPSRQEGIRRLMVIAHKKGRSKKSNP